MLTLKRLSYGHFNKYAHLQRIAPQRKARRVALSIDVLKYGKAAIAMIDTGAIHNFMKEREAKRLDLSLSTKQGVAKADNLEVRLIKEIVRNVPMKFVEWQHKLDEFQLVLGLAFLKFKGFTQFYQSSFIMCN